MRTKLFIYIWEAATHYGAFNIHMDGCEIVWMLYGTQILISREP